MAFTARQYALMFLLITFSLTARAQNNKTGFLGLVNVLIPGDTRTPLGWLFRISKAEQCFC